MVSLALKIRGILATDGYTNLADTKRDKMIGIHR
jgi:hypothetical protein